MRAFTYERAGDASEAIALVQRPNSAFLGGGTNLVDLMRLGVATPETLVDVARLPYRSIDILADGTVRIGGAVRNSTLAADATIRRRYPALSRAILAGASGQLRNMATTGGNLMQRTRCTYFMDPSKPCNKRDPGSGCPARSGYHRSHAIFGWSEDCIATHPSDMAVALTLFDAVVRIEGTRGARAVPITAFYRLPDHEPQHDTVLEPGELITAVDLPSLAYGACSAYRKARDRASYAFALVSVAAALDVADDGGVRDVRIALGGVAHKPWRATAAEDALRGRPLTEANLRRAAEAELNAARPLPETAFKIPLARNLIVRALLDLGERR
jgi:xanthine dehydrogenase YagS FAD-binding subunit